MKILTIIGSPRKKGNSYRAARKLELEMKSKGDYEFEYLFLKDAHLETCKGCFNCLSRGIEFCPLKDDLGMIQEKMDKADGLVMVSPVYVMHVTSLAKNFIDRLAYLCHRPEYHGKMALVLSTTGGIGAKETLNYMETILQSWGYQVNGKCGLVTAPWSPTEGLKKKNEKNLQKSAEKFHKSLKAIEKNPGKLKVGFMDYMGFKIFQTVSENSKDYLPADYQFYQNKEYYTTNRIGLPTRILSKVVLKVVFYLMRDLGPGDEKT